MMFKIQEEHTLTTDSMKNESLTNDQSERYSNRTEQTSCAAATVNTTNTRERIVLSYAALVRCTAQTEGDEAHNKRIARAE